MKNIIVGFLLLTSVIQANAQTFQKRYVTKLDEPLTNIQADWVSMNADTLLDVVIAGAGADGQMKIVPYQNLDTTSYFVKTITQPTGMKAGHMQVADWNRDGKMDLLISAKTLINTDAIFVFNGVGNFTFQKQSQKILDHSGPFLVADLDNDAVPDILTFGDQFIRVHQNSGTTVTVKFEVTGITPTDISVFDMDRNGTNDFVVSGHDQQNKPITSVFYAQPAFKFTRSNTASPVNGALSLADVNDDGLFDIIVTGNDQSTITINRIDTLIQETTFDGLPNGALFSGDMTSNGKPDVLLSAKKVNYIRDLAGVTENLDTTGLILQRMGDQDRDGDLDLVQVIDSVGSQWLKFYENVSPAANERPANPGTGFAISTFNKTFIFWEPAIDDHTVVPSLTYDVWLGNLQETIISPSYDLASGRRTVVRHGNAGTNMSMVIRGLTDDRYFYSIQAVDNAYNGSYSVCSGGVLPCFDLAHEDVQACKNTEVKLAGEKSSVWYSMSSGFLGQTDTLKFVAMANDTLFSFTPMQADCSKNKVYVVNVNEAPPSEQQTIYSCNGKTLALDIDPGWTEIRWNTTPPILNVSSIDYLVDVADTVTVTATSQGCTYKKQFFIRISEPHVEIEGDGFQVLKGNSVQLVATGNVETWQWDPQEGLSNNTIPNPLATPSTSTEYILTGTDSVGCTATARTTVLVQETAFVPNLFTPNGDGKNDSLTIYGLTTTSAFNFKIFNREGSVVYETKDIGQATTSGWNGFVRGTRQPSGIYYWKIDGETPTGDKLLLNGKTTGSILLVH
jgi:gliding motility-associated-like protein